jgi:V/A-type H+-transporting ATPase subunit I
MAMLQMQRIYIYALKKDRKPLLEMLQRRGNIEISDYLPEDSVFHKTDTTYAKTSFEKSISTCKDATTILDQYVPVEKPLLAMLNGRKTVSTEQYDEFKDKREATLRTAGRIIACNKEIIEHKAEIQRLEVQAEMLTLGLLWIYAKFSRQRIQRAISEPYQGVSLEEIYEKLAEYTPVNVDIISTSKEQTCILYYVQKNMRKVYLKH